MIFFIEKPPFRLHVKRLSSFVLPHKIKKVYKKRIALARLSFEFKIILLRSSYRLQEALPLLLLLLKIEFRCRACLCNEKWYPPQTNELLKLFSDCDLAGPNIFSSSSRYVPSGLEKCILEFSVFMRGAMRDISLSRNAWYGSPPIMERRLLPCSCVSRSSLENWISDTFPSPGFF